MAAAAPAYAVSGRQPTITGGQAFKLSGNSCSNKAGQAIGGLKAYLFTFRVTNNDKKPIYLYGAKISISGTTIPFEVKDADPDWGTPIAAGAIVDVTIWGNGGDSGHTDFTATAEVFWGHVAAPGTLALPITSNADNPDKRPNNTPWHAAVTVGPWKICGTPTLPSQDLEKCENPGFIPVPATCPQPQHRRRRRRKRRRKSPSRRLISPCSEGSAIFAGLSFLPTVQIENGYHSDVGWSSCVTPSSPSRSC